MERRKRSIRKVAIYLRKSRDEERVKDVLRKHRTKLVQYAKENNWEYTIYEEIESGESIDGRDVFQKLLNHVSQQSYDAVLVMHYDRLSRGGTRDFGIVIDEFKWGRTHIATPDRIYDVTNRDDLTLLGMQSVLGNHEHQQTSERYQLGKHAGAREGKWTNGKPPYPYYTDRKVMTDSFGRKILETITLVNQEQNKVYQRIKKMYLSGSLGTEKIAIQLNKERIASPGGKKWSSTAVQRLLSHEFHLGLHKYGEFTWEKNRGKYGRRENEPKYRVEKNAESNISRGRGKHDVLKTEDEHLRIMEIMKRNQKIPKRSRVGTFPTSGIMMCKKCGYYMGYSIGRVEKKSGMQYHFTKCSHKSPEGEKCDQRGVKMDDNFYKALYHAIIDQYLDEEYQLKRTSEISEEDDISHRIDKLKDEENEKERKLVRIMEAYEDGIYNRQQFSSRKGKVENAIRSIRNEIDELASKKKGLSALDIEAREDNVKAFMHKWPELTSEKEQNQMLKSLVKSIYYNREGDIITFEIEYL